MVCRGAQANRSGSKIARSRCRSHPRSHPPQCWKDHLGAVHMCKRMGLIDVPSFALTMYSTHFSRLGKHDGQTMLRKPMSISSAPVASVRPKNTEANESEAETTLRSVSNNAQRKIWADMTMPLLSISGSTLEDDDDSPCGADTLAPALALKGTVQPVLGSRPGFACISLITLAVSDSVSWIGRDQFAGGRNSWSCCG